jgi:tRNA pseudouridine38-40 synthase
MQQGAELVLGRHDFSGFAAAAAAALDRRRTVFLSQWKKKGRSLRYDIEADGFLHHMVRNIVGTLLQVGLGKRPPADVSTILGSRDRRNAGPTAAPCGLYLVRVWYPIDTEDLWGSALGPGRMMV